MGDFTDARKQLKFPRINCRGYWWSLFRSPSPVRKERISFRKIFVRTCKCKNRLLENSEKSSRCFELRIISAIAKVFNFYHNLFGHISLDKLLLCSFTRRNIFPFQKIMKSISHKLLRNYEWAQKGYIMAVNSIILLLQKNYKWIWGSTTNRKLIKERK